MKESNMTDPDYSASGDTLVLREVDGWIHQVADLQRDTKVHTLDYNRPVGIEARFRTLKDLVSVESFRPIHLSIPERTLTPRSPYVASPLSYLNAFRLSWSLWAGVNRLEWAAYSSPEARHGKIEFFFHNVVPGTTAIVSILLTVGVSGSSAQGKFEVRASHGQPRWFVATARELGSWELGSVCKS